MEEKMDQNRLLAMIFTNKLGEHADEINVFFQEIGAEKTLVLLKERKFHDGLCQIAQPLLRAHFQEIGGEKTFAILEEGRFDSDLCEIAQPLLSTYFQEIGGEQAFTVLEESAFDCNLCRIVISSGVLDSSQVFTSWKGSGSDSDLGELVMSMGVFNSSQVLAAWKESGFDSVFSDIVQPLLSSYFQEIGGEETFAILEERGFNSNFCDFAISSGALDGSQIIIVLKKKMFDRKLFRVAQPFLKTYFQEIGAEKTLAILEENKFDWDLCQIARPLLNVYFQEIGAEKTVAFLEKHNALHAIIQPLLIEWFDL